MAYKSWGVDPMFQTKCEESLLLLFCSVSPGANPMHGIMAAKTQRKTPSD